ncbi:unnamed protein product [Mycena citricolor]|uniref:P-loop containing nucleoside triphosphate hydrolase protein n=1 Tax=Mycena citricolor TaxID=2018698 RepID=A0AAD2HXH3_9AGAR|nr:unnamed protein product [Mycena citricolor]
MPTEWLLAFLPLLALAYNFDALATSSLFLPLRLIYSTIQRVSENPQAAELFRFIFLGTIVEAGKKLGQLLISSGSTLFVVNAEFQTQDFAYDWVVHYLVSQCVFKESRFFRVVARNAATRPGTGLVDGAEMERNQSEIDGHPDAVYEPAAATPIFFRWQGYWISVNKTTPGFYHYDDGREMGGTLIISIWSWDRKILDQFVNTARQYYIDSKVIPRKIDAENEPSHTLVTAVFPQGDVAYDWMLAYLRSENALVHANTLTVSTKQSDLGWGTGADDLVCYLPAEESKQQFLFASPRTGVQTWLQVTVKPGTTSWSSTLPTGGSVTITLHSCNRDILSDLIHAARAKYLENGTSRVSVHLTDNHGQWAKTITKSRRALSTLILPGEIKEQIIADAREFLDSEGWYADAGVPYRRGYLLYGEPGTGKSSTIHALAGELGLEIYFVSLANPGIDDYTLAKLISDTPSRCIILLEDIDCAFPSRDDADDEEDDNPSVRKDGKQVPRPLPPPKSQVTLSGLLNVLDSVSSTDGRLTVATTNHIENLDSALIRAGRMDMKIQYTFADTPQIEQVFARFFPHSADLARAFAEQIPPHRFSVAQIQGYLLTKKRDAEGAVFGAGKWIEEIEDEKRAVKELKAKRKAERRKREVQETSDVAQTEESSVKTIGETNTANTE